MTVLVAINTRDAIVLAADSQGTITRPFVDPADLSEFFDPDNDRRLRTSSDGQPLLDTWSRIASHTIEMPYKVHSEVEKLFALDPLKMGVMASGIASIGDRTIKSLIADFKTTAAFSELSLNDYTLGKTASSLLEFLWPEYEKIYTSGQRPDLELMICGYDTNRYTPGVIRVYIHERRVAEPDYDFCIFFGGITREIQRLLFGIDSDTKLRLMERNRQLLATYHSYLSQQLKEQGVDIELPKPEDFGSELSLFNGLELNSLRMNCATYSEQDAVECADFLVNVMIKSQRFSDQIPTTGGKVQTALIKKHSGFRFISPRHPYMDDSSN